MGNPVLRYLKRDLAGFRKRPKAGVQVGMPKVPVNPDHLEYLIKDFEGIASQLAEAVELLADAHSPWEFVEDYAVIIGESVEEKHNKWKQRKRELLGQASQRKAALDELTRLGQEMGDYDR